jgi:CHAT domain-containing protein
LVGASPPDRTAPPATRTDLRRLTREVEDRLHRARDGRNLREAAILKLAAGRPAEAIDLLEEAVEVSGRDPGRLADLGAAYLSVGRGHGDGRLRALLLAVARLVEARDADRAPPEATFNLALGLESLGLRRTAADAWLVSLARESDPAWHAVAASRLSAIGRPAAEPRARNPQQLRLRSEDLLCEWGESPDRGDEAKGLLRAAADMVDARGPGGDRMAADALAAITVATGPRLESLREGHAAYARGSALGREDRWVEAAPLFAAAERQLRGGGSPFAAWARVQGAIAAYYMQDYTVAITTLSDVIATAPSRYPALRGRALWMRAVVERVVERPVATLADSRQALAAFEGLRETGHVAYLQGLVALAHGALGEDRDSDRHWLAALAGLDELDDPRRMYSQLREAADMALADAGPQAAVFFYRELQFRVNLDRHPAIQAETLLSQARVETAAGPAGDPDGVLAKVPPLLAAVPEPLRSRIEADLAASRGLSNATSDPGRAAADLGAALGRYRRAGFEVERSPLSRARAWALARLGRRGEARAELEALARFEAATLRSIAEPARSALANEQRRTVEALVPLLLDEGDPAAALRYAEMAWAGQVETATFGASPSGGTVVAAYLSLPEELVVWTLEPGTLQVARRPVGAAELRARVARFREHFEYGRPTDRLAEGLYRLLLGSANGAITSGARLVVIPDLALEGLPFAALRQPERGCSVIELTPVAAAGSLAEALAWRAPACGAPSVFLAAGESGRADGGGRLWSPLPGAAAEVEEIARIYGNRAQVDRSGQVVAALGRSRGPRIVHLAVHGFEPRLGEPGLLVPTPEGPGVLLSRDVRQLPLSETGLVVLASCGSSASAGQGPRSLSRAFRAAGAASVVAALWDVPDARTARFLVELHRRVRNGASPAEALRGTQLAFVEQAGSPFWAAWQVAGPGSFTPLAGCGNAGLVPSNEREGKTCVQAK